MALVPSQRTFPTCRSAMPTSQFPSASFRGHRSVAKRKQKFKFTRANLKASPPDAACVEHCLASNHEKHRPRQLDRLWVKIGRVSSASEPQVRAQLLFRSKRRARKQRQKSMLFHLHGSTYHIRVHETHTRPIASVPRRKPSRMSIARCRSPKLRTIESDPWRKRTIAA